MIYEKWKNNYDFLITMGNVFDTKDYTEESTFTKLKLSSGIL